MSGLSCGMWDLSLRHTGSSLQRTGFSLVVVQAPGCAGSVVVVRGLSCPTSCGILVLQPGFEPASPALEGRFLTTGPPGKSQFTYLKIITVYLSGKNMCGHWPLIAQGSFHCHHLVI